MRIIAWFEIFWWEGAFINGRGWKRWKPNQQSRFKIIKIFAILQACVAMHFCYVPSSLLCRDFHWQHDHQNSASTTVNSNLWRRRAIRSEMTFIHDGQHSSKCSSDSMAIFVDMYGSPRTPSSDTQTFQRKRNRCSAISTSSDSMR